MASYDLPAMINYVLNQTGHNQLIYIGHSLAVNAAFGLLSTKLEYNDKVGYE